MKVIFLDVDGVLNRRSTHTLSPSGCMFVEDILVATLASLVRQTEAQLVLSSTWRKGYFDIRDGRLDTSDAEDYDALVGALLYAGLAIRDHTPLRKPKDRAAEITRFLADHPEVDSYVILDDEAVAGFGDRQVKTDPRRGLTRNDVRCAADILAVKVALP